MKRIDIVVDLETLGNKIDSSIIQFSAVAFNINSGEILGEFNEFIDTDLEEVNSTSSTIAWWLRTNPTLLLNILDKGFASNQNTKDVLLKFNNWIDSFEADPYLWGNGILFDNKIIEFNCNLYGVPYPIFYRNDRDIRTLIELVAVKRNMLAKDLLAFFNDSNLVAHYGLDDCKYEARVIVYCYNFLTKYDADTVPSDEHMVELTLQDGTITRGFFSHSEDVVWCGYIDGHLKYITGNNGVVSWKELG